MPETAISQALSALPLFAPLPESVRKTIVDASTVRSVSPSAIITEFGAPAREMFVVLDGYVKLTVPQGADGAHAIIDVVGPGAVFGEAAVTGVGTYATGVQALDAVTVVAIDGRAVHDLLARDMTLVFSMLGSLSGTLRGLLAQVTELKLKTTAQRLAMYLLQLGGRDEGPLDIQLPFGKRTVAEKLGMTPETLSRSLAKLELFGVTQKGRGRIAVADAEILAEYCGFMPETAEDDP